MGPLSPRHDYLTGGSGSNAATLISLNDMSHLNNNSQSNIIVSQADVTTSIDLAANINIPVKTIQNINVAVSLNNVEDNDVIGPSFKQSMIIDQNDLENVHYENDGSKMNVMDSEIIDDVQSEFPCSSS